MGIERTLEGYVAASAPPRWMERLAAIDTGIERERRELAAARARAASDADWRRTVAAWRFDEELNELIETHNEWFPVERRLPVDPRTGEYARINGEPYQRPVLDADWALAEFPW